MKNIFRFRFGLRAKLVVVLVSGIVIGFTIIGIFRLNEAQESISQEISHSGQERISLIAESLANLIVAYDYSNMESVAERIVKLQDVQQITIRNLAGKVMVSRNSPNFNPALKGIFFEAPVSFSGQPIGKVEISVSLERLEKTTRKIYRRIIVTICLVAFFFGLLIYAAVSMVILRPIGHFRDLMISILNNPSVHSLDKLQINSRDEIGELANIFNDMNAKVYESQQRLQEKYVQADTALIATNQQLLARTKELESTLQLVEQLATTDSLTGLPNRRYFDEYLATTFSRAVRFKESLCMLLLDVDNFKQINDQLGHGVGDFVLRELGTIFLARTRDTDVSARLGGDEFVFLLYHTDIEQANNLAQSLLKAVREHAFVVDSNSIRVTLSIGIAQVTADVHSVEGLYGNADHALYQAKRNGRDQAMQHS